MNITRDIEKYIKTDLKSKMVFVGGPRQVGKTTLSKGLWGPSGLYLNWDDLSDRETIKSHKIPPKVKFLILDEIHKYRLWRTLLKGLYDKFAPALSIIVTGSARLDLFKKGGDSLFGRYHYYRLHPFDLAEVDKKLKRETTQRLLEFGGFPEPYTKQDPVFYRRWGRERINRVVFQDIRDLEKINDLGKLDLLVDALPERVGSSLSLRNLAEDLEVSPNTIKNWVEVLERVYYCYRISPFGATKIRAVKKNPKLYLWDWAGVKDLGARYENMVAGHLLKYCHFMEDTLGYKMELRYLKDVDSREIDFVVIKDKKPQFAVECKTGEKSISKHIHYFKERTNIPFFYQVHLGTQDYQEPGIRVLPFEAFCGELKRFVAEG